MKSLWINHRIVSNINIVSNCFCLWISNILNCDIHIYNLLIFVYVLDVNMMNIYFLFIFIWLLKNSSVICDKTCSREGSRMVREYFTEVIYWDKRIFQKKFFFLIGNCSNLWKKSFIYSIGMYFFTKSWYFLWTRIT